MKMISCDVVCTAFNTGSVFFVPIGLEAIHQMTSNTPHDLRVELEDWNDIKATAEYRGFSLSSASDNYTLFFQSFVGGDAGIYCSCEK